MARTNDALSVEDVLAAGGGMQGLKDVLSTVVQDALQSDPGGSDRPAWCGPLGTLGGAERDAQRVAPEDGVDPRGRRRGEDPQAPEGFVLPGAARAAPPGRPGPVGGDHDCLRDGHVHTEVEFTLTASDVSRLAFRFRCQDTPDRRLLWFGVTDSG